jgi:hypothetical protein
MLSDWVYFRDYRKHRYHEPVAPVLLRSSALAAASWAMIHPRIALIRINRLVRAAVEHDCADFQLSPTRQERFELPTFGSVDRRSIQLSYWRRARKSRLFGPPAGRSGRPDHGWIRRGDYDAAMGTTRPKAHPVRPKACWPDPRHPSQTQDSAAAFEAESRTRPPGAEQERANQRRRFAQEHRETLRRLGQQLRVGRSNSCERGG